MIVKRNPSSIRRTQVIALSIAATILFGGLQPALAADLELGDMDGILTFLEVMDKYIALTEQMQSIAADDTRTAGFAVLQVKDIYDDMGRKAESADVLREMLKETTNKPIRNLIRLQLADVLKNTGKQIEAIAVLREIIRENAK